MDSTLTSARCESAPIDFLSAKRESFEKTLRLFVKYYYKTVSNDFKINYDAVDRVSNRLYQRLNYYLFFHNSQLAQSRQAGLKAYWVLRYRPLKLISLSYWKKVYDINVYFAFFVILSDILSECLSDCNRDIQHSVVSKLLVDYENIFIRSFSEYDISKESMMIIADNLKKMCLYEVKLHTQ
jgi:hypothetical protein